MDYKKEIIALLADHISVEPTLIERPPDPKLGDYAIPMFRFAKQFKKNPALIAKELAGELSKKNVPYFEKIENKGPYLNFFINRTYYMSQLLDKIKELKESYGNGDEGKGKSIVIDYSSPNIAKPFGIAHIRSTVIGHSLYKIFTALGYKVWRINHLGDWGTQFGKLIVAYRMWGNEEELERDDISYLMKLYVRFGKEAEKDPSLNDLARAWFKKLEDGDPEARALWERFREISLKKFETYYKRLGVEFDYYQGEAFYNTMLEDTIEEVKKRLKEHSGIEPYISEGALIVDLSSKGIKTPLLLRKSDGATTYHTRDLAAALYRLRTFKPVKILYVVGAPQKLHFEQLFATLELMGFDRDIFVHVPFGNMTYEGVMMSTRRGNFIPLSEVIDKAVSMARNIIEEKNPDLEDKDSVAEMVGVGAIIFGDLSNDRIRDVDFKWEKALNFEGDTAPYLQYVHARICSIKRKVEIDLGRGDIDYSKLTDPIEYELAKKLGDFGDIIRESAQKYKPSILATYLLEVGKLFNKFYNRCKIKGEPEDIAAPRLMMAEATRIVIKKGLDLLGIKAPEKM